MYAGNRTAGRTRAYRCRSICTTCLLFPGTYPPRFRVRFSAPQLPRPTVSSSSSTTAAAAGATGGKSKSKSTTKKNKKKRARPGDADDDSAGEDEDGDARGVDAGDDEDKAGRVYQSWLEARYLDFLRVLLGWIAEVDDFYRQVKCFSSCGRGVYIPTAADLEIDGGAACRL